MDVGWVFNGRNNCFVFWCWCAAFHRDACEYYRVAKALITHKQTSSAEPEWSITLLNDTEGCQPLLFTRLYFYHNIIHTRFCCYFYATQKPKWKLKIDAAPSKEKDRTGRTGKFSDDTAPFLLLFLNRNLPGSNNKGFRSWLIVFSHRSKHKQAHKTSSQLLPTTTVYYHHHHHNTQQHVESLPEEDPAAPSPSGSPSSGKTAKPRNSRKSITSRPERR